MIDKNIVYKILAQNLQDNYSAPTTINWENVTYTPDVNTSWIQEFFVPNESPQVTLGTDGDVESYGFYQLNVKTPSGTGTVTSGTIVQELSEIFKIKTTLSLDGYDVYIESFNPAQGIEVDGWWVIPITIDWSCYMAIN